MYAQIKKFLSYINPGTWLLRLIFGFYWLIIFLPWPWLMALGKVLGRIALYFTPLRVQITDTNLRLCFPELDDIARQTLVRQHFESMGMGMMDMGLAWWASEQRLQRLVKIIGIEHAEAALNRGKGVIFLTAHFTSIEIGGRVLLRFGPMHPVYRPHQNAQIELLVKKQREYHTGVAIPRNDIRLLLKTLRDKKGIWFAPDQNFSNKGFVFAQFFGIPAATTTATVRLAQLSGAAVVPFVVFRREDAPGYEVLMEPALENFPSGDIQLDTDRVNAILERWIRSKPNQYLWSHRRFKDRPDGQASFY